MLRRTLAIVLLAGCAGTATVLALRGSHRPALPSPAIASQPAARADAPGASASAPQPAAEPASPETPIPESLPDARVPDLSGTPRSLRDFLGHPLIVNFWATWCEPCRREMPLLQGLQQRYGAAQGLQVLGVAVDTRSAVEQYLHARPVNYTVLAGEDEATAAMNRFGAQPVLPFSVFVDAQGRVVVLKLGELHAEEADYILASERDMAAGHQTLAQARAAIGVKLHDLAIARAKASGGNSEVP